jgi:hypothetical protein
MQLMKWCGDGCVVDLLFIFDHAMKVQGAHHVVAKFVLWISSYYSMLQ